MTMLEKLPEMNCNQTGYFQLTLSSEVFPAKIYPLPAVKKALPMRKETKPDQDCGLKCSELFKRSDPLGWSLRMSVGLSISPLIRSRVTLKVKATKSGQSSFLHVRWVRPTKGKDSSSWATPNTMDCLPSRSYEAMMRQATGGRKNRSRPGNLREQIDPLMCQAYDEAKARTNGQMWRTPDANCFRGASSEERMQWELDNGMPVSINDQVKYSGKMWPTPGAADDRDRGNLSNPCIQKRIETGKQVNLSMCVSEKSGQLNPDWVEILMGFPVGWTDVDCDEPQDWQGWPAPLNADGTTPTPTAHGNYNRKGLSKNSGDGLNTAMVNSVTGQYDYEPPRVTTTSKNRKDRLKAIGNAVCPKQAVPIFLMIREWENE